MSDKSAAERALAAKAKSAKGVGYTKSDEVEAEIEKRRKEEEEAREKRKNDVSERMKKLAGAGGTSPGFSTAALGAQIAAVTRTGDEDTRNKSGGISVKSVVKKTDGTDDE